ncbi:MAG: hypothetical protein AB7P03_23165 [Kofleriaceae bacterium]
MKLRLAAVIVAIGLVTTAARADVPWAAGVSEDHQSRANTLLAEGNELFAQQAHGSALEKYKAAIELWDHPLIRFNMAVALIRLDRILDAAENLDRALRFGQAPFTPALYQHAMDYQKLISGRVGAIEVDCDQSGAHVLLDGKPWFACPDKRKVRVIAGEHVLVGEREGYLASSRRVIVFGGRTSSERLELLPIDAVVKLTYPSPRWMPWSVLGGGAAIVAGGLGAYLSGKSQLDQFKVDLATRCPNGCLADLSDVPDLARERDRALLKGKIATAMFVTGGALIAGGIVWVVLNRPKRVVPRMEVTPTQGGAAASATWLF